MEANGSEQAEDDAPRPRRLSAEGRDLAERHLSYALSIARQFRRRYARHDLDWEGEAALALCKTVLYYDTRLNEPTFSPTSFRKHLSLRVNGACWDLMRSSFPRGYQQRDSSLSWEIPQISQYSAKQEMRFFYFEPREGHDMEEREACFALLGRLSEPLRGVIVSLYYENCRHKDVAQVMGVSRSYVTILHANAIARLREIAS